MAVKELQSCWKKAKEQTSLYGPITFSHYKAIALHYCPALWETHMTNKAMKSGYSYQKWRYWTDVKLLKKANSYRVDKMQTIVLFEASHNFMNKYIARKMVRHAKNHEGLATEQYGSRKDHRAIEHALNKVWTMDIF